MSRCCVANLTHMLQLSSFRPNACSSCFKQYFPFLRGGENIHNYFIKSIASTHFILDPLPVLVVLKVLRDILSFTRSFMIYTRLQKSGPLREQPTGKVMIETHQSQLLKINQSQRSIMLYKVSRKQSTSSPTSTQSKRRDLQFKVTTS